MNGINWTPEEMFKLSRQTWSACALMAAVKLDLFTALDEGGAGGLNVRDLAGRIEADARATDMLATALASLGLLEREGETVLLTESSRRYLSARSPEYFGFIIKHTSNILPGWTKLDQAVKTGRRVARESASETEDEQMRENFLMGMFNVARRQAEQVASVLDLTGRRRLLDLGGGPGTYAIYFCLRCPELSAVVFDQPETERFALKTVAEYGLADRVSFKGGDFLQDELPRGYDTVWLSQVLHGESPADAAGLIERAAEGLPPGGLMGVQEFIIDDDRRGPAQAALFSLNMLVQTSGGQSYTESEIRAMMADAGLTAIERLAADLPPGCGILTGRKP